MNDTAVLELPDDPILLKQMIKQRDALLVERESQIDQIKREAAQTIEAIEQRHKAELAAILRRFYGPRSEAFDPTQLLLFGLAIAPGAPVDPNSDEAKTALADSGQKLKTRRINHHGSTELAAGKHGRRELPANLPRVEVPHDLTEEQKKCPC